MNDADEKEKIECPVDSMEANTEPIDRTPDMYRRRFERCPHCDGTAEGCLGHRKWE